MADALIELSSVSRWFETRGGPVDALTAITCIVNRESRVAVIGPSGSGKSTLLALMANLDEPSEGSVSWPRRKTDMPLRPAYIGLAFQTPSLIPALTAIENVELPLLVLGDRTQSRQRAGAALDFLELGHFADRLPEELSGGQAQRVALARAMVTEPRVILADEPTGQLDQATGHIVVQRLIEWVDRTQASLVVATHDPEVAKQMRETWHMLHGKLQIARNVRAAS